MVRSRSSHICCVFCISTNAHACIGQVTRCHWPLSIGSCGHSSNLICHSWALGSVAPSVARLRCCLYCPPCVRLACGYSSCLRLAIVRRSCSWLSPPRHRTLCLDVRFSPSHRIRSSSMSHEGSLVEEMLGIHVHVTSMLILAPAMANLLTDMRPMGRGMGLAPWDDLLAVQIIRKPPILPLFLAFALCLSAKRSLVLMLCLLHGLRLLAVGMSLAPHKPTLKLLEPVDVAVKKLYAILFVCTIISGLWSLGCRWLVLNNKRHSGQTLLGCIECIDFSMGFHILRRLQNGGAVHDARLVSSSFYAYWLLGHMEGRVSHWLIDQLDFMQCPLVLLPCSLSLFWRDDFFLHSLFPALPCFLSVLEPHLILVVFYLLLLVSHVGSRHKMGRRSYLRARRGLILLSNWFLGRLKAGSWVFWWPRRFHFLQ